MTLLARKIEQGEGSIPVLSVATSASFLYSL